MIIGDTDYIEAGNGRIVILVHSNVAGANQWRSLMGALSGDAHVIAVNLFGYGKTCAWHAARPQRLKDQAKLLEPFLPTNGDKISIVGHSFGGSVAMKAAAEFKDKIDRLVLIEPNPFYLLAQHNKNEAFQDAITLQDAIKTHGRTGNWGKAAEIFANYWTGAGSWHAMDEVRKAKFADGLAPNFHEWDCVMNEQTSLQEWERDLPKNTTIVSAKDTVRSIADIVSLMETTSTGWRFETIERGGHMAALTLPDLVNPIVINALN